MPELTQLRHGQADRLRLAAAVRKTAHLDSRRRCAIERGRAQLLEDAVVLVGFLQPAEAV